MLLVVHYLADLQLVHELRCYGNNANPSYKCEREMLASDLYSLYA